MAPGFRIPAPESWKFKVNEPSTSNVQRSTSKVSRVERSMLNVGGSMFINLDSPWLRVFGSRRRRAGSSKCMNVQHPTFNAQRPKNSASTTLLTRGRCECLKRKFESTRRFRFPGGDEDPRRNERRWPGPATATSGTFPGIPSDRSPFCV